MVAVLVAPRTNALRCAACHDDLGGSTITCDVCGTALHAECRFELRRCPSLGCRGRLPAPRARLVRPGRPTPRPRPFAGESIVRHAYPLGAAVALANTGALALTLATKSYGLMAIAGLVHLFAIAPTLAVLARRPRQGEGVGQGLLLPSFAAFLLQVVVGPFVLALALALFDGRAPFAGFALAALEPLTAGWLVALATSAHAARSGFEA